MGRIVIVVYRPHKGKEEALLQLIGDHIPVLKSQGFVTDRKPIVMRAADNNIVEVFEWRSAEAIDLAHSNPAVLELWNKFNSVCDFETPTNVKEFGNMFSEFESIN